MSIPLERFFQQPPLAGQSLTDVTWHPNGRQVSFLQPGAPGSEDAETAVLDLWTCDLDSASESICVAGGAAFRRTDGITLRRHQWFPDGARLLLLGKTSAWEYSLATGTLLELIDDLDLRIPPVFSPDGSQLAFIRDGNLGVLDLASRVERMLTVDGSATLLHGVLDWVYWEELGNRKGWRAFEWSPDSQYLAYLSLDQSRVPEYPLLDWMCRYPKLTLQRYPKAGEANSTPLLRVVNVRSGVVIAEHREADDQCYLSPCLAWNLESTAVAFTRLARDQRSLELRLLSSEGQDPRVLFRQQDANWLNRIGPPLFLPNGEFLWVSEQSGRAHLYRHDAAGTQLNAVTHGEWQVESVHRVSGDWVCFSGTGLDPRERHLYRARIDGSEVQTLTELGGVHQALVRDDGAWALVTSQTPSMAPETALLRVQTAKRTVIRHPSSESTHGVWPESRFVQLAAEDGSTLYGRLLLPLGFNPNAKYPVVVHVYGGPHAQTVQLGWTGNDPLEQILARSGFLVWRLDNRGSWGRGHAFEVPVDRRLGETELLDQLRGVEYLRSLPYVDADRIGITGWSYGGYLTLYALTHAPEIWRCGVAGAPVTDWALYDSVYTERYMGTPATNAEGYRTASPIHSAERLRAPLLIAHGTDDDNVHLQHTLQFVEALSRHRLPYELLIQPKQTHGFKGEGPEIYLHQRILEFFQRQLHPR